MKTAAGVVGLQMCQQQTSEWQKAGVVEADQAEVGVAEELGKPAVVALHWGREYRNRQWSSSKVVVRWDHKHLEIAADAS